MHIHKQLHRLDRLTAGFLRKVDRKNKPLQALYETDEFASLKSALAGAIRRQAADVAKLIKGYGENVVDSPDKLGQKLQNDMPRLNEYLSDDKVVKFILFAFEYSARASYMRMGVKIKKAADKPFDFQLTNERYISQIKAHANYLLNKSTMDETTRSQLINTVSDARADAKTIDETADIIAEAFDEISDKRAFVIARTEAANAAGSANYAVMTENHAPTKMWVVAGPGCDVCDPNEDAGEIPVDQPFPSGDMYEPAHPNCECYTQAGEIDLESIDLWSGN